MFGGNRTVAGVIVVLIALLGIGAAVGSSKKKTSPPKTFIAGGSFRAVVVPADRQGGTTIVSAGLWVGTTTCGPVLTCWSGLSTNAADAVLAAPLSWVPVDAAHFGTSTVRSPPLAGSRIAVAPAC